MSKSLANLLILGAFAASCDDPPPPSSRVFQQIDAETYKTDPDYDHGYRTPATALALIDQLTVESHRDKLAKDHGVTENQIQDWQKNPPALIYGGKHLSLNQCGDAKTKGAKHLAELWTQGYLLKLFSGEQVNWFEQAMSSLQETDPKAAARPIDAAHPNLVARLAGGMDPNMWSLNAIRFRIADFGSLNTESQSDVLKSTTQGIITTESLPDAAIVAQIKINYELDVYLAKPDPAIQFAAAIHSIAIRKDYLNEFIVDVLKLDQTGEKTGCQILDLLNKWVRHVDHPADKPMRSGYFFMHTNIFDRLQSIREWRFAELKPVDNDHFVYSKRGEFEDLVKEQLIKDWAVSAAEGGVDPKTIDFETAKKFFSQLSITGSRNVFSPFENTVASSDIHKALRIVPMSFPVFLAPSPFSDRIEIATNREPISIWYSGSQIDEGRNPFDRGRINLLIDQNGKEVPIQHPGRRHEETWTCAQCHARQVANQLQSIPSKWGALLDLAPFLNFRHIGYGDGGDLSCNGMFGMTRPFFQPEFSEYLLDTANGKALYKYHVDHTRRVTLGIVAAMTSQAGKIDYFRCQGNRYDFIAEGMVEN